MSPRGDTRERFRYQALLVSGLLKDQGLYELEPHPLPDGLILSFEGSSPVALFQYFGVSTYRLKMWDGERGWKDTNNYGSIVDLVIKLGQNYRSQCQLW